jgi:HSP20 family protein
MTQVRFKNHHTAPAFNNLMADFFPALPSLLGNEFKAAPVAPVNITEREDAYVVDVLAAGWEKEDFKISLEKKMLTISAEEKPLEQKEDEKVIRKEFRQQGFKRSFTIDEKIDDTNISAKYVNGVLTLNLPKKAEVKQATKQITIQ